MSKQAVSHKNQRKLRGEEEPSKSSERFLEKKSKRPWSANENAEDTRKPRPLSAKRVVGKRVKVIAPKESEPSFLIRLKPRQVPIEKERLYEENMTLKHQSNVLREEMVRLKTRINQLEREVSRKDDMLADFRPEKMSPNAFAKEHLVHSLKSNIKDLRNEVKHKDNQIDKLRRHIKSTQNEEQQIEINAYIEECNRLKQHLHDALKGEDRPPRQEEVNYKLKNDLNSAKFENEKLKEELMNMKNDFQRAQDKNTEKEKKSANGQLKGEIMKLRALLENEQKKTEDYENLQGKYIDLEYEFKKAEKKIKKLRRKPTLEVGNGEIVKIKPHSKPKCHVKASGDIGIKSVSKMNHFTSPRAPMFSTYEGESATVIGNPKKKPPKLLKKIKKAARSSKMPVSEFLKEIDKNGNGKMEKSEFIAGMKQHKQKLKEKDVEEVFRGSVYIRQLEDTFRQFEFSPSSSDNEINELPKIKHEQIQEALMHFTFKMRVKGMEREDFLNRYNDDQLITKYEMTRILGEFQIDDENLCRFLLESQEGSTITDLELSELQNKATDVKKKLFKYMNSWTVYSEHEQDTMEKEISFRIYSYKEKLEELSTVSVPEFYEIMKEFNINFSEPIQDFLSVVFYEQSSELNTVYMPSFVERYGTLSENQIKAIFKKQLQIIASKMSGKTLKEVFEMDENGFISENLYYEGLQSIGINSEDYWLSYFFFAKEKGIDIEQFEEYMIPYGIPKLAESEYFDTESYKRNETPAENEKVLKDSYSSVSDAENLSSYSSHQVIPVYQHQESNFQQAVVVKKSEEENSKTNQKAEGSDLNDNSKEIEIQGNTLIREQTSEENKFKDGDQKQAFTDQMNKKPSPSSSSSKSEKVQSGVILKEDDSSDEDQPISSHRAGPADVPEENKSSKISQDEDYSSDSHEDIYPQKDIESQDIHGQIENHNQNQKQDSVSSSNADPSVYIQKQESSVSSSNSDPPKPVAKQESSLSSRKDDPPMHIERQESSVSSSNSDPPKPVVKQESSLSSRKDDPPMHIERQESSVSSSDHDTHVHIGKQESSVSSSNSDPPKPVAKQESSLSSEKYDPPNPFAKQDSPKSSDKSESREHPENKESSEPIDKTDSHKYLGEKESSRSSRTDKSKKKSEIGELPVVEHDKREESGIQVFAEGEKEENDDSKSSISSKRSDKSNSKGDDEQIRALPEPDLPREKSFSSISSKSVKQEEAKSSESNDSSIQFEDRPKEQKIPLQDTSQPRIGSTNSPFPKKVSPSDSDQYPQDFESVKSDKKAPQEEAKSEKSSDISSSSLEFEEYENYSSSSESF